MTDGTEKLDERDEIELLLPWYVMGRLDAEDHARVDAYLETHPDMRAQLRLIEEERLATAEENEAIRVPDSLSVERLLADARPSAPQRLASASRGVFEQLRDLVMAPQSSALRWAAAAIVAVMLAQAVTIGTLLNQEPGSGYELASGEPAAVTRGTEALVRFKDGVPIETIVAELQTLELTLVAGPDSNGLVTVRISEDSLGREARDARLRDIRAGSQSILLITAKPPSGPAR